MKESRPASHSWLSGASTTHASSRLASIPERTRARRSPISSSENLPLSTIGLCDDRAATSIAKGAAVSKFLVLYRSSASAREQMANATPEQAQAGMEAWQAWAAKAGPAIVDLGAPLEGEGDVAGFSILQAGSRSALDELLAEHPHRQSPGASIDALEFIPMPGM